MKHQFFLPACTLASLLSTGSSSNPLIDGQIRLSATANLACPRGRSIGLLAFSPPKNEFLDGNKKHSLISRSRGGACSDSTPELFAKVGLGAATETFLMHRLLVFCIRANSQQSPFIATAQKVISLLLIIFGSASFGQLIDTGLSSATRQILSPNQIPGDEDWYSKLKKPKWNPPGWLFPIMWLIVSKPTQFVAVWKILGIASSSPEMGKDISTALLVYCAHLSLGDAWNKVFFGLQCTGRGLAVITAFWSFLWFSAFLFYNIDMLSGLFLLPTCLWVTVAATLNLSIFSLNKESVH